MLMEVGEFCTRIQADLNGLIDELQELTGRYSPEERKSWRHSLPKVSILLSQQKLNNFHIYFGQSGGISIEYRLPASSSWCDVVLLGRGRNIPSAVLIELKNWDTKGDKPGPSESLIEHQGHFLLHPSDQIRGYSEYCRRFHSAIHDCAADISGCVYFTLDVPVEAYYKPPHDSLINQFPVFSFSASDIEETFPAYLSDKLHKPDFEFAKKFETGVYKQDRNFCRQIAQQIENTTITPFVLLDGQRLGFELCRKKIDEVLIKHKDEDQKTVIIIEGPPGSGKSVLAARLWADLVNNPDLPFGNIVITTTSGSQKTNWKSLVTKVAGTKAAAGIIKPASGYSPATTQWVGRYRREHPGIELKADTWKENLKLCLEDQGGFRCPDDIYLISIVDEAHALVNPEKPIARSGQHGFPIALGPQAYHIIRASKVSIFLMDSAQGFRDNETTSREDIVNWAKDLSATASEPISLAGSQFRCGGSKEYLDWLEGLLELRDHPDNNISWRNSDANPMGRMKFNIVNDPLALEEALRPHGGSGASIRLLAAYGRKWITQGESNPHDLPPEKMDFNIPYERDGESKLWYKIWNYAPKNDYTSFIQAPAGTKMYEDSVCEVGCPYTVRGFDYDYIGLLWLKDLIWRDDRWKFDQDHIHESALRMTLAAVKKEKGEMGPASQELLLRLKQIYRILLSRAIYGVYIWFEDEETRAHVEFLLPK